MNDHPNESSSPARGSGSEPPPQIPEYEVFPRVIGSGSYGCVYLARNRATGTWRAVKVVYRSRFEGERPYEREFKGLLRFEPVSRSHASQLNILNVGRDDAAGYFYYVMELADPVAANPAIDPATYSPRTLASDLATRGRLPYDECVSTGIALSLALDHLHQKGLTHCDIKPANIVFVNGLPKLADIGSVGEANAPATIAGSIGFIPREGPGQPPADIYSLGKVFYEMSTGRDRMEFPQLAPNFGQLAEHDQLREFNAIWLKSCEPEIDNRHASAAELHTELAMLRAGRSVQRERTRERQLRWMKRVSVAAAILLILGVGITWAVQQARIARLQTREVERLALIRGAQTTSSSERKQGWRERAGLLLSQAATFRVDSELIGEAIEVLGDIDARVTQTFTNFGASGLVFDRTGQQLAITGPIGQNVRLWDFSLSNMAVLPLDRCGPIIFDPTGNLLAFAPVERRTWTLLRPDDRIPIRKFPTPPEIVAINAQWATITMSADGQYAAIAATRGSSEGRVVIWNLTTGERVGLINGDFHSFEFAPDGSLVAAGDSIGRVHFWSLLDLTEVQVSESSGTPIMTLAFVPSPYLDVSSTNLPRAWLVAAGGVGGSLFIWDTQLRRTRTVFRGSYQDVLCVALSPDGMTLASGGHREVRLWDLATARLLLTLEEVDSVRFDFANALAFSPQGDRLAVGTRKDIDLWWSRMATNIGPQAVDARGKRPDEMVSFWDLDRGRGRDVFRGMNARIRRVELSGDGSRVAALSDDWKVGIWDLRTRRLMWVFGIPQGLRAESAGLKLSPDGRRLAASAGEEARLWDLETGRQLRHWSLPWGLWDELEFAGPDRLFLFRAESLPGAVWNGVGRVRDLLAADPSKPLFEIADFNERIFEGEFGADAQHLVVAGQGATKQSTKMFETHSGRELQSWPTMGTPVILDSGDWISFTQLADNSKAEQVLMSLKAGQTLLGWNERVTALCSTAGLLVAGDDEASCRLFRIGEPDKPLELSFGQPRSSRPQFSRDGRLLAWGTVEGTVVVCDIPETLRHLKRLGLSW